MLSQAQSQLPPKPNLPVLLQLVPLQRSLVTPVERHPERMELNRLMVDPVAAVTLAVRAQQMGRQLAEEIPEREQAVVVLVETLAVKAHKFL